MAMFLMYFNIHPQISVFAFYSSKIKSVLIAHYKNAWSKQAKNFVFVQVDLK